MNIVTVTLRGITPLLMSDARTSDPLDEWAMKLAELTGKRKKTHDDYRAISKTEWFARLYRNEEGHPYIPSANGLGLMHQACKRRRMGQDALAAITPASVDGWPLVYDGPKDAKKLWDDGRFSLRKSMKQKQVRIIRTRPMFPKWSVTMDFTVDPDIVDPKSLKSILEDAGKMVGFCDGRPVTGRFMVEKFDIA